MKNLNSMESLITTYQQGKRVKYIFFWGHRQKGNSFDKSCFSNWFRAPFEIDGVTYDNTEQYMMAEKAKLFGDEEIYKKILKCSDPGKVKALGRSVKNFTEGLWIHKREEIVFQGNLAKFQRNFWLKEYLLNTGNRVLVEASPVDKIWGVGLSEDDPKIENPLLWKGINLLGFTLMKVRDQLVEK